MKQFFLLTIICAILFTFPAKAQVPTVQDCMGAIPVCLNTYNEYNGYTGVGPYNDIPSSSCPTTCMSSGERNSVWYTFTVQTTGWFDFRITPYVASDDYDWALFNLTTDNCSSLNNTSLLPTLEVSCNWSADGGITGANNLAPNTGVDCWGSAATANNPRVWVTAGSTYYLNVSNFTGYGAGHGYMLDMTNGSAVIFDNVRPYMMPFTTPACGATTITITMSENVMCSSVIAADFTIAGYTVTAVSGATCVAGGTMENTYTLTISPGLAPGTHTLCINGSSGHISDLCGNLTDPAAANNCRTFTIPGTATTVSAAPASVCAGSTSVLTAAGATTYSWSGGLGTGNPVNATPGSTTAYTVTGTTGGCTSSATTTVTVTPGLTVTIGASANPICAGASTTLTAAGATSYSWSGGLGTGNPVIVSPGSNTTYTVTGTTAGCTGSAQITVTVNPIPTVTVGASPTSICTGGSSTLTAGGATSYSWSGGLGTGNPVVVNPAATTAYTVTGTAAGCTNSATATVSVSGSIGVTIAASANPICPGASSTLTASGGTTYSWSGGLGTGNPVTVSPIASTSYSVTGTTAGCTGSSSITININPTPTVSAVATPATICAGASSSLTGAGASTYTWSGGLTAGSPTTASPGSTTTYTVTGTSVAGCTGSNTVIVNVNPLPTVTLPANVVVCNNGAVAGTAFTSTPAGATYTWTNSNTAIGLGASGSGNIAGFTATNPGAAAISGTITVTPTLAGCTGTASTYTITVNPTDNPAFNYTPSTLCQTGTDTPATITGGASGTFSAAPAGLVFSNTATGLIDVSASALGTYTITFNTSGTCPSSSTATVTITSAPIATFSYGGPYCLYDANPVPTMGAGASTGTFSAAPAGLSFVSTATGVVNLAGSTAGTYTVTNTITAAGGCAAAIANASITINPTPTVTVPANFAICNGATVPASAMAGTPAGVTYAWTNSNTAIGLAASGTGNVSGFTAANTGTAPITATISVTPSANGCTGTVQTYMITVNPTPTVSVPANITACNNTAVAAASFSSPTSGATFAWTNSNATIGLGASGTGNIAGFTAVNSGSAPVTATITVTPTANGCTGTASTYTITVNPSPTVTVPANINVCGGAAIAATAFTSTTPGATFAWTNSNTGIGIGASGTGDIPAFTATNATTAPITATITVTPSANGCTGTASTYTITVNPAPSVSVPANVTACNNTTVPSSIFSSTTPGTTFAWTNSNTAIGLPASGTGSILSFTGTNTGTAPITATITVTPSANGCSGATASFTITINPSPSVTVPANSSLCTGGSVPAANYTSTTAGTTFAWTNSNASIGLGVSGTGNAPGFTATNTGAAPVVSTITVTPTANGCTGTASSYTITVNPLPTINFPALADICVNAPSVTLSGATPAGGVYSGTGVSGGSFNPVVSGTGTFVLTYTFTSASGCTNSATQNIIVKPQPSVSITPQDPNICLGNSVVLTSLGADTYVWSPAAGLSITTGNLVTASPLATTIYVVTGTTNGCTNTANVTVNVYNSIPITMSPTTASICPGESTILSASGAITYVWSPATGLSSTSGSSVTATPAISTIYNVVGTDLSGCTGSANTVVIIYPLANIAFLAAPKQGCAPLNVNFLFAPGSGITYGSWLWNFGDDNATSTDSSTSHLYMDNGTYVVLLTAQTIDGCDVSAGDTITVFEVPVADFIAHPDIITTDNPTVDFIDQSINENQWSWNFGDPGSDEMNTSSSQSPSHNYGMAGDYEVVLIVENDHGCADTAIKIVSVNDAFAFWIPNAFSPNEDLVNDLFFPQGVGFKEETYSMRIFDRWGKLICYTEEITRGWDGTDYNNGKMQPDGVYTYQILVTDDSNHEHEYIGSIILLK